MAKLFVLAIPSFGSMLVGKVNKDNFEQWRKRLEVLKLIQPKRFVVAPANTQSGDPTMQSATVHIGPAYFGDTDQELLYIENAAIEIIGEVEIQHNQEVCSAAKKMFDAYSKTVQEYAGRHSPIISPNVLDIHNVSKGAAAVPFKRL